MKKWFCDTCGHIAESDEPPATCPRCKSAKFILQEDEKKLADVSLFSREVHGIMKLDSLLTQILDACEKGIQTNTCANCTPIFTKIKDDIGALKELTKKEIKSHIIKGNWG